MSWNEISVAKAESKYEIVLTGSEIQHRIEKAGLDESLFKLININFLEISRCGLCTLSDGLGKLTNLTNLVLHNNKLERLPPTINSLEKLKFIDVSNNELTELGDELSELKDLESLNVACNNLESFFHIGGLKRLHILDVSHNRLETLPEGVTSDSLLHLAQINAGHNRIKELPSDLCDLPSLKNLDVENNALAAIPAELCNCVKLKDFNFANNKLKDRRLGKMMGQCSTRAVLDYLRGQLGASEGAKGGKVKKGKGGKKGGAGAQEVEEVAQRLMRVLRFPDDELTVTVALPVLDVRPYIVICAVTNLDLSSPATFKSFIALQTRLHEGVCQRRLASTIATHDLRSLQAPLTYTALPPPAIQLVPLFRSQAVSAEQLVAKLLAEAEETRKEKKRNQLSGIHKYLELVDGKPLYACLTDAQGTVISFPPITNCDPTKVSAKTTAVLLEVTSSLSLDVCKRTMHELLEGMLGAGLGGPGAGGAPNLTVQQVRVLDHEGSLKVVYPSRTDLQSDAFGVARNYE